MKNTMNKNGIDYVLVGDYCIPDLKAAAGDSSHRKIRAYAPRIPQGA